MSVGLWLEVRDPWRVVSGLAIVLLLFTCVLLHELGHALTAQRFGFETREITLLPIGGIARLERLPDDPMQSLWIALAGPAVNVALAAALFGVLRATGAWRPLGAVGLTAGPFLEQLMLVNVSLAVFNMLPAFPMDGGRALRALLATRFDQRRATRIAARLGQAFALLFMLVGWFSNPVLLLIGIFVWLGAAQESAMADRRAALRGVPVSRVMLTAFRTLDADDLLSRAVDLAQHEGQHAFVVTSAGRAVGLLTDRALRRGLAARGPQSRVADAMEGEIPLADASEPLEAALDRLDAAQAPAALVIEDGRVQGLLTLEGVAAFLELDAALPHRAA
jgi:Zn-dependent protease